MASQYDGGKWLCDIDYLCVYVYVMPVFQAINLRNRLGQLIEGKTYYSKLSVAEASRSSKQTTCGVRQMTCVCYCNRETLLLIYY